MEKDFWKSIGIALSLLLGFGILFVLIVLILTQLTDSDFMESSRSVQAIGTLIAISIGGAFAYYRLQMFRTFAPHLTISHQISHRSIGTRHVHISVTATLHNNSKVKMDIREAFFLLQQVSPVSDEEVKTLYDQVFENEEYEDIQWATLEEVPRNWEKDVLIVEPGERHPETCEFIVPVEVNSVIIYTYFYNSRFSESSSTPEGWSATTVYDIMSSD